MAFLSPSRGNSKHLTLSVLRERLSPILVEFQLSFTAGPLSADALYKSVNAFLPFFFFFPNGKFNGDSNTNGEKKTLNLQKLI